MRPAASMTQGALFSLVNAAIVANKDTNVRVNEIYLGMFVMADAALAKEYGVMNSAEFGKSYAQILAKPELRGARLKICQPEDLERVNISQKLA